MTAQPPTYDPATLTHLSGAMNFEGRGAGGQACAHWAAALVLDLRGAELAFGTFEPLPPEQRTGAAGESTVPFIHAWVEWRGWVYAPTLIRALGGRLVPIEREAYYRANGARDVRVLPRARFDAIARRWGLSAAFRHRSARAGNGDLLAELLAAAGVRYTTSADRTLLPAP